MTTDNAAPDTPETDAFRNHLNNCTGPFDWYTGTMADQERAEQMVLDFAEEFERRLRAAEESYRQQCRINIELVAEKEEAEAERDALLKWQERARELLSSASLFIDQDSRLYDDIEKLNCALDAARGKT